MSNQDKWDQRFLQLAELVASWSKDPSTQCGAVIADAKHRVVSLGFNGFPRGVPDDVEHLADRETKYAKVIHAEVNALLFARQSVEGCTIYVWPVPPCSQCTSKLVQAGITRVVSGVPNEGFLERWEKDLEIARVTLRDAGVEFVQVAPEQKAQLSIICKWVSYQKSDCQVFKGFGGPECNSGCSMYDAMAVPHRDARVKTWNTRGQ